MSIFKKLFGRRKKPKIKIGLALGSGGAKGFAELGVIRALEENGVVADVVGGTSIGSIIGAFYANGYTSTDIISLLETVDVKDVKRFIAINMSSDGLNSVIDRYLGDLKIEELSKPFVAVATNVDTGEEVVFRSGKASDALCASSAYPPYFKPVIIDGKRFVDGAFTNSVPADRVKELGADVIIGVDLSDHKPKQGFLESIIPPSRGGVDKPWQKGYEYSDVMLHPNLEGYSSVAFSDGNKMFEIGYAEASSKMDEIKRAIDCAGNIKKRK